MRPLAAAVAALVACSVAPAATAATGDIQHRGLYINDAAGDNDGWLEPGEPFKLRETVRNASDTDRTHVTGTLVARPVLGLTASASPFGDLAAVPRREDDRRAPGRSDRDRQVGRRGVHEPADADVDVADEERVGDRER